MTCYLLSMTQPVQSCSHNSLGGLRKTGPFYSRSRIGESFRGPRISSLDCSSLDSEEREGTVFLVVYPLMSSPDSNKFQTHGYIDGPG